MNKKQYYDMIDEAVEDAKLKGVVNDTMIPRLLQIIILFLSMFLKIYVTKNIE